MKNSIFVMMVIAGAIVFMAAAAAASLVGTPIQEASAEDGVLHSNKIRRANAEELRSVRIQLLYHLVESNRPPL
jgi:hypothetical protein